MNENVIMNNKTEIDEGKHETIRNDQHNEINHDHIATHHNKQTEGLAT
jgi:hypothetical protein